MGFYNILLDVVLIPAPKFSPPLHLLATEYAQQKEVREGATRTWKGEDHSWRPAPGGVICHMGFFHMGQALLLCLTWTICLLF